MPPFADDTALTPDTVANQRLRWGSSCLGARQECACREQRRSKNVGPTCKRPISAGAILGAINTSCVSVKRAARRGGTRSTVRRYYHVVVALLIGDPIASSAPRWAPIAPHCKAGLTYLRRYVSRPGQANKDGDIRQRELVSRQVRPGHRRKGIRTYTKAGKLELRALGKAARG